MNFPTRQDLKEYILRSIKYEVSGIVLGPKTVLELIERIEKLEENRIELNVQLTKAHGSIKYYFSVLESARGKDWDKKPDHVLNKFMDAIASIESEKP